MRHKFKSSNDIKNKFLSNINIKQKVLIKLYNTNMLYFGWYSVLHRSPIFKSVYSVTKKQYITYKQLCCVFSTINSKKIGLTYLKFEKMSYDHIVTN